MGAAARRAAQGEVPFKGCPCSNCSRLRRAIEARKSEGVRE